MFALVSVCFPNKGFENAFVVSFKELELNKSLPMEVKPLVLFYIYIGFYILFPFFSLIVFLNIK